MLQPLYPKYSETAAPAHPVQLCATPEPALLAGLDPVRCLAEGWLPWTRYAGRVVIISIQNKRPDALPGAWLAGLGPIMHIVPRGMIDSAVNTYFAAQLLARAHHLCPEKYACRDLGQPLRWSALGLVMALSAGLALAPFGVLALCLIWLAIMNTATAALRLGAVFSHMRPTPQPPPNLRRLGLPVVTVLMPMLNESAVLGALLARIAASTYPKDRLDVLILLEHGDRETASALAARSLPDWLRVLTVPADYLRTKPKAMNYALPFCRGSVIGIYDAEDRPDPDQIARIVAHLQSAPPDVACVQGFLDFYNPRANWLSRCFTIEYAIWFRILLKGVQRMGLPIPLGGTTVFFRRAALETVGGWDAHNVTEDADLGFRLARFGYRCAILDTTTWEEANCLPLPWIKQRARWLKGYAMTWVSQMRRPWQLYRDLGLRGFLGFQILVLGALSSFLSLPLVWGLWLTWITGIWQPGATLPPLLLHLFFVTSIFSRAIMIAVSVLALWAKPRRHLMIWLLTLPFYWPLGGLAAWRAVVELIFAPFYWAKTRHGLQLAKAKADTA